MNTPTAPNPGLVGQLAETAGWGFAALARTGQERKKNLYMAGVSFIMAAMFVVVGDAS
jgi:hypothetical protein